MVENSIPSSALNLKSTRFLFKKKVKFNYSLKSTGYHAVNKSTIFGLQIKGIDARFLFPSVFQPNYLQKIRLYKCSFASA